MNLHHTLEHLESPTRVLLWAAGLLRPGGYIMITVPNFGSMDRRIFGRGWLGLQLPVHLHHFTPASLKQYLAKTGFEAMRCEFLSNDGLWPRYYSESLRRSLAQAGLYKVAFGPTADAGPGAGSTGVFESGRLLIDLAHKAEYAAFRQVGRWMDRLGLGSTVTILGQKAAK